MKEGGMAKKKEGLEDERGQGERGGEGIQDAGTKRRGSIGGRGGGYC